MVRDEQADPGHGAQRSKPHPHTPETHTPESCASSPDLGKPGKSAHGITGSGFGANWHQPVGSSTVGGE